MSYNVEVIFPDHIDCWFSVGHIKKALYNSNCITGAFVFRITKQGFNFWRRFADGENQEEGRAILRAFLNERQLTLEDLI